MDVISISGYKININSKLHIKYSKIFGESYYAHLSFDKPIISIEMIKDKDDWDYEGILKLCPRKQGGIYICCKGFFNKNNINKLSKKYSGKYIATNYINPYGNLCFEINIDNKLTIEPKDGWARKN